MTQMTAILANGITPKKALENLKSRVRSSSRFFENAALIEREFPDLASGTLLQAEMAAKGLFRLPGNPKESFIGNPPAWHADPYGDLEYVYQLNRMDHWLPMLQAFYLTKEEKYPRQLIRELENWIDSCPPHPLFQADGVPKTDFFNSPQAREWRVLECGIRGYRTWTPVLEGLCLTDLLTEELFSKILESLDQQCRVLSAISPLAWPKADHNHYLMECLGLFSVSCLLPELREGDSWKNQAMEGLIRCMEAQVTEDGAQIEGCPSYHNGCIFWFAMALACGRKYSLSFPENYRLRFLKMAEYALYTTRPSGSNVPWGDTGTKSGTLTKAAVCTYLGTGEKRFLGLCRNFYSYETLLFEVKEQIWRIDDLPSFCRAVKDVKEQSYCPPALPLLHVSGPLKQAFLRTGWDRNALSLMFACRTPIQNLHAHIDPCGFDFTAYGVPMVVDPGRFTYKDGPERRNFKTMAWHNTLMLNGREAFEYLGSWAFGPQKEGKITGSGTTAHSLWVMGCHENYSPAVHRRAILIIEGKWIAVLDQLEHLEPETQIRLHFHLDRPELKRWGKWIFGLWEGENVKECRRCFVRSSLQGEEKILPARVSDRNDEARPSSIIRYEKLSQKKEELIATALYPQIGREALPDVVMDFSKHEESGGLLFTAIHGSRSYTFLMTETEILEIDG